MTMQRKGQLCHESVEREKGAENYSNTVSRNNRDELPIGQVDKWLVLTPSLQSLLMLTRKHDVQPFQW